MNQQAVDKRAGDCLLLHDATAAVSRLEWSYERCLAYLVDAILTFAGGQLGLHSCLSQHKTLQLIDCILHQSTTLIVHEGFHRLCGSINLDFLTDRCYSCHFSLHLTVDKYHQKYGPVVHMKLGGIDSAFLSSADHMRLIFSHEGKYPKHTLPPAWLYFNQKHKCERGILFM